MQALSTNIDKTAIGLSLVCVIHCLLTPVAIVMLPILGSTFLEDERFHFAILFLVLPTSLYALFQGCRRHHQVLVFLLGVFGLLTLFMILILGEERIGEAGEKISTVIGTAILTYAHVLNLKLLNKESRSGCKHTR